MRVLSLSGSARTASLAYSLFRQRDDPHSPIVSFSGSSSFLHLPRLAPFLHEEPDDGERGDGVDPPGAEGELGGEADHDDEGQPEAGYRLGGVGAQGAAAELVGQSELAAGQHQHDRDRQQRSNPGEEKSAPSPRHKLHAAATTT